MTRAGSLETMISMFGLMLLAGIGALVLLGSAAQPASVAVHQASDTTIDWLRPDQVYVPSNLVVSAHVAKQHNRDTERIYKYLLEGKCAEVAKFCGGSEQEFAYFCVDPVTGIVGAILQIGDEITTGYYEKSGSGYWVRRVPRERWEVCQ